MGYSAKILADSITRSGTRLTTLEAVIPRIVLAELNTHRTHCLAGDSRLEFDLPAGHSGPRDGRRVHTMRLDEFVDKWNGGARRIGANPKQARDTSKIDPSVEYTGPAAAELLGMATPSNIHGMCRTKAIPARRHEDGRTWLITGAALLAWRAHTPSHTRFDIRTRLEGMRIRQLNETTGDIQYSHVVGAVVSGEKEVWEVRAGDFRVAGSLDHRIYTAEGWKTIGDLLVGDLLVVRKFGKKAEDKADPRRLRKIDGVWRNDWQRIQAQRLREEDPQCRRCRTNPAECVHHVVPVYVEPTRALDATNITYLCEPCHAEMHVQQGWQGGTYLYGSLARVDSITFRGVEPTFDLEIAGDFPNFLANGVVVHNSRCSASSRAIPVEKRIEMIERDPFIPETFGKNRKGMQSTEDLDDEAASQARLIWTNAKTDAIARARELAKLEVHKQLANRLLEPFAWHTVVLSATEWENFYALRCHPDAQGEMRRSAEFMQEAMHNSTPRLLEDGEWHLPYITEEERLTFELEFLIKVSCGRCARVSYRTFDGKYDPHADYILAEKLAEAGHMSPLEHPARPMTSLELETYQTFKLDENKRVVPAGSFCGNFRDWIQARKRIRFEHNFALHQTQAQGEVSA